MPFLLALKAIGWSGAWRWVSQRVTGVATGSTAWAIVAVCALVGVLIAWRIFDPPERTYTAAEIRANRLEAELRAKDEALEAARRTIANSNRMLEASVESLQRMGDENEQLRKAAPHRGATVLPADDQWLQRKRSRAGGG